MAVQLFLLAYVSLAATFTATAYGSQQKREAALTKREVWKETPAKLSSVIADFNLQPVSSTSLQATWRTKYEDGTMYFEVCLLVPFDKTCTHYTTDAKSQQYRFDNLKPDAQYSVSASYDIVVKGAYHKWHSTRTVKMPPPGWEGAASSLASSGLLVLMPLLHFVARWAA
ncbi:hypothetical protein V5799_021750 [Amblyomma americanum]|uniref:Secreted protein n=1 Tax=Amblyomma americanum TaxID=6943 RepID=A0AAQ4FPD5_AMBAM